MLQYVGVRGASDSSDESVEAACHQTKGAVSSLASSAARSRQIWLSHKGSTTSRQGRLHVHALQSSSTRGDERPGKQLHYVSMPLTTSLQCTQHASILPALTFRSGSATTQELSSPRSSPGPSPALRLMRRSSWLRRPVSNNGLP